MKTELSHDIIAEKIWDRLPEQDKRFLDIERSINQRTQDFRRGTGDYLGPKELAAWEDAFARFPPESDQYRFIQESKAYWQAEKEAKEQRQREELEKAKQQVEKERSLREAAVKAQNDAESARIEAEKQKTTAEANARQARDRTRMAVAFMLLAILMGSWAYRKNLQSRKALTEIADRNLKEVQQFINKLEYEAAWKILIETPRIGFYADSVPKKMLEPAFWYMETGNLQRAEKMLDTIAQVSKNSNTPRHLTLREDSVQYLRAWMYSLDSSAYKALEKRYYPEMISVKGGTFQMGNDSIEKSGPAHWVTVDNFQIAVTETTVFQWFLYLKSVGKEKGISDRDLDGNRPQGGLSWNEAVAYTNWLNDRRGSKQNSYMKYRLPTEAEWEYAAMGGGKSRGYKFSGSDTLDEVAWTKENSEDKVQPARLKKPNELGLFDMSGNVKEWCQDWSCVSFYKKCQDMGTVKNPVGAKNGEHRVIRGEGVENFSKRSDDDMDRWSLKRHNAAKPEGLKDFGFRVVLGRSTKDFLSLDCN